jgi:hypothetical protein
LGEATVVGNKDKVNSPRSFCNGDRKIIASGAIYAEDPERLSLIC